MFDELPPTSRCITTTRLASRDFEIGARTLSWRVVNSTSKSNSFQILRALVDDVRAERPTELTDKSNITFTLWRSHRIWASSSAVMKIAQRRDSFALLTQSPLFHCPSRALFPYHFDRDASPRRQSTNQSSAFLRDVIP